MNGFLSYWGGPVWPDLEIGLGARGSIKLRQRRQAKLYLCGDEANVEIRRVATLPDSLIRTGPYIKGALSLQITAD